MKKILARYELWDLIKIRVEDMDDVDLAAFFNRNFKGESAGSNGDGTFVYIKDESKTLEEKRREAADQCQSI